MNNTIKHLSDFFENRDLMNLTLGGHSGLYVDVFRLIVNDIEKMNDNDDHEAKYVGVSKDTMNELIGKIKHRIIFERNNASSLNFHRDFLLLVFNWNNNIFKNEKLGIELEVISKLIESEFTMRDTIQILKAMNEKMADLRNWNPPAFEISKSLFNKLK